jgi:hypothetical protein
MRARIFVALITCLPFPGVSEDRDKSSGNDGVQYSSPRRSHIRFGGFSAGAGYARSSGAYYPFWPSAWWPGSPVFFSPYEWYGVFYHPLYFTGFAYGLSKGSVRLERAPKTAEVYLDGAYAGTAGELKNMWLDSGAYDVEVRASGGATFRRRVYVLSGKTLKLRSDLEVKP